LRLCLSALPADNLRPSAIQAAKNHRETNPFLAELLVTKPKMEKCLFALVNSWTECLPSSFDDAQLINIRHLGAVLSLLLDVHLYPGYFDVFLYRRSRPPMRPLPSDC